VQWLGDKLTNLLRPWHDNKLPRALAFEDIEAYRFTWGAMERAAKLSVNMNMEFGVFGVIGIKYASRASRAWWPFERLLMEDVSCAFLPVSTLASKDQPVPGRDKDRLVFLLDQYLADIGSPWPKKQIASVVDKFIRECPKVFEPDAIEDVKQDR
jgi:hypothetical protein